MRIDPVSLRLFLYVAEHGTIAAGAQRLNIVTSAASKRLQELETAVDAQLLRRNNRGVEPTAAGVTLMSLARSLLDDLDSIGLRMRDYSRGVRGHVRLLAGLSAICQVLPVHLASFALEHPEVNVDFEERDSTSIVKGLKENSADIGIATRIGPIPEVQELPYYDYKLAVLVPAQHPLAARKRIKFLEVLDHPQIGLRVGGPTSTFMARMAAEANRTIKYRMNVESYDAMVLMIHAGLGIGIIPRNILVYYSRSLRVKVVPLDEPWAQRKLCIYVRANERLTPAARLLVDHLQTAGSDVLGPSVAMG